MDIINYDDSFNNSQANISSNIESNDFYHPSQQVKAIVKFRNNHNNEKDLEEVY